MIAFFKISVEDEETDDAQDTSRALTPNKNLRSLRSMIDECFEYCNP